MILQNFKLETICKKLIVKFAQGTKTYRTITFTGDVMNKTAVFLYAINANIFDKYKPILYINTYII